MPDPADPPRAQPPSASRLGLLRDLGDQAVLHGVFAAGPITRPEIAIATGLSKPTVSSAIARLEKAGLVRADGARAGARGRSPIAYVVSDRAGFTVGCEITDSTTHALAADLFGEPLARREAATPAGDGAAVAARATELVEEVIAAARPGSGEPLAVGLSVPGVVEPDSGRVICLAHHVVADGAFDPAALLRERLGIPVHADNDVNLAALGERAFGVARDVSTLVYVAVATGIGMGIVIDDALVRGAHGAAGEIGYLPLAADPFDPRHHARGGLEDEIGAAGVLAAHTRALAPGAPPAADAPAVLERAAAGEPAARAVVSDVAARIATAIATVCAVVDPELVVLGGAIGASPLLLGPVRAAVAELAPAPVRIEVTALRGRASLHGALGIALRAARRRLLSPGALVTGLPGDRPSSLIASR